MELRQKIVKSIGKYRNDSPVDTLYRLADDILEAMHEHMSNVPPKLIGIPVKRTCSVDGHRYAIEDFIRPEDIQCIKYINEKECSMDTYFGNPIVVKMRARDLAKHTGMKIRTVDDGKLDLL